MFLTLLGQSETCKEYYDDYWIFGEEGSGETETEEEEDEEGSGSGSGDKGIEQKFCSTNLCYFLKYVHFRIDKRRAPGYFRRETLQT